MATTDVDFHTRMMDEALVEARRAATLGEVPVGAVLVGRDGGIIARGHNLVEQRNSPTAHAEGIVLEHARDATGSRFFPDATLYVTLEPCVMCTGVILAHRLKALVFGVRDPKAGACGSVLNVPEYDRLPQKLWVRSGVREAECREVLEAFFARLREKDSEET